MLKISLIISFSLSLSQSLFLKTNAQIVNEEYNSTVSNENQSTSTYSVENTNSSNIVPNTTPIENTIPSSSNNFVPTNTTSTFSSSTFPHNNSNISGSGFGVNAYSYSYSQPPCGFSIGGGYKGYGNSQNNNEGEGYLQIGWSSNPCIDQLEIEAMRQVNETERIKIIGQTTIINTCITSRVTALQQNINPDLVCKIQDLHFDNK